MFYTMKCVRAIKVVVHLWCAPAYPFQSPTMALILKFLFRKTWRLAHCPMSSKKKMLEN